MAVNVNNEKKALMTLALYFLTLVAMVMIPQVIKITPDMTNSIIYAGFAIGITSAAASIYYAFSPQN